MTKYKYWLSIEEEDFGIWPLIGRVVNGTATLEDQIHFIEVPYDLDFDKSVFATAFEKNLSFDQMRSLCHKFMGFLRENGIDYHSMYKNTPLIDDIILKDFVDKTIAEMGL